jgi:hypothetical protein
MGLREKIRQATLTDREKLMEALNASPVCSPLNTDLRESTSEDGEIRMLLNPNNQKCFNFGWFTYQDFYDWIQGTGKIVKGNTPEEKQKYWEVAVFEKEYQQAWGVGYYKKHFHLIDETYRPKIKSYGYTGSNVVNPLKITKNNHDEIIAKVFGDICRWYSDYKLEVNSHTYIKMDSELMGAKQALYILGVGYYGAVNTPEEAQNLSWIADICKHKANYLYFLKNNIKLPDFDFVYNNNKGLV